MSARPALASLAALLGCLTCARSPVTVPPEQALLPIILEISNYNPFSYDVWIGPQGQQARKVGVVRGYRTARFVLEASDLPPLTRTRVVLIGPGVLTHLPEIFARPGDHLRYLIEPPSPLDRRAQPMKIASRCRRAASVCPDPRVSGLVPLPVA